MQQRYACALCFAQDRLINRKCSLCIAKLTQAPAAQLAGLPAIPFFLVRPLREGRHWYFFHRIHDFQRGFRLSAIKQDRRFDGVSFAPIEIECLCAASKLECRIGVAHVAQIQKHFVAVDSIKIAQSQRLRAVSQSVLGVADDHPLVVQVKFEM